MGCAPGDNFCFSSEFCLRQVKFFYKKNLSLYQEMLIPRGTLLFVGVPSILRCRQFHRWWYRYRENAGPPVENLWKHTFALL